VAEAMNAEGVPLAQLTMPAYLPVPQAG